jgi:acyl-CoA dehydrogenase
VSRSRAARPLPGLADAVRAGEQQAADPQPFLAGNHAATRNPYAADPTIKHLIDFFQAKGVAAIKDEDRGEQWYDDWLAYQKQHHLYASVLASKDDSDAAADFDLLRFARFIEVFGYFSPAHAYSLQVSYLALFAIRLGTNDAIKREAFAALEAGGLLAFGISEREHGSDLLANEFTVRKTGNDGQLIANGRKYYIGNTNVAAIVAILAGRHDARPGARAAAGMRRSPPVLVALRPHESGGGGGGGGVPGARKIRTLGIRAAFVGDFNVTDQEVSAADIIADGRDAWDAVFGAVTLGRFFLGFGSVGICEHAMREATMHLAGRVLYCQPAIALPHIRSAMARGFARLSAMKLYAFRALDYVAAASEHDRRYLLFTAVQKAKVSTDGVRVMSLISECVGAKGFESDTYIEMALRDIQLIPGLEGSTHLNLKLAAQFVNRYFAGAGKSLVIPRSLSAGEAAPQENPYLMSARTGPTNTIDFPHFLAGYRPLRGVPNVRLFVRQAAAFRRFVRHGAAWRDGGVTADLETTLLIGQCVSCIAYAQLVTEAVATFDTLSPLVSAMFDLVIGDLTAATLALASLPQIGASDRVLLHRAVTVPQTTGADWEFVAQGLLRSFAAQ